MYQNAYNIPGLEEQMLVPSALACGFSDSILDFSVFFLIKDLAFDHWVHCPARGTLKLSSLLDENMNKVVSPLHLANLPNENLINKSLTAVLVKPRGLQLVLI